MQSLRTRLEPALQSWYKGAPFGYADLYAEELSYFDPGTDGSLNGIEALRRPVPKLSQARISELAAV